MTALGNRDDRPMLDLAGIQRPLSAHFYNTDEDVDRALQALAEV